MHPCARTPATAAGSRKPTTARQTRCSPSSPGLPNGHATHLIDAYCGAGFFARHLRGRFERVVGLEWDRRAVAQARRDAAPHERYLDGDVAALLPDALAAFPAGGTLLIVDPALRGVGGRRAPGVVGDAAHGGWCTSRATPRRWRGTWQRWTRPYEILSVTPLDMFPQTAEVEVVAHLARRAI